MTLGREENLQLVGTRSACSGPKAIHLMKRCTRSYYCTCARTVNSKIAGPVLAGATIFDEVHD
jgi:hypothetical protein